MSDKNNITRISKYLSYLLRHGAEEHNLGMSADGFVEVDKILKLRQSVSYKLNLEMIKEITSGNDKKRFELKQMENSKWMIRACQGHTLKTLDDSQMLEPLTDSSKYPMIVHGTFLKFWPAIRSEGLKTMSRNHVHFATGLPKDKSVISGMRRSCEVFIELDLAKALGDGMEFFVSSNGVVLTRGFEGVVDPKYFKRVVIDGKEV